MAAIVTSNMRVYAATEFMGGFSDPSQSIYMFIGQTLPWLDDNSPPSPIDCEKDESSAYRNMMSAKLIGASNVSLIIPRYNWTTGTVYTPYQNNIDLFDPTSGLPPFYVITSDLNVYKCLNNNKTAGNSYGGAASTVMPTGTVTSVVTSSDGYQWKYMYTVNSADVLNFVTNEWIPVETLTVNDGSNQWAVQQAAVPGTVDRIDMTSIGSQYTVTPTITIQGDGTGATASAVILGGNVVNIVVTSAGQNYTYANVVFTGGGVGANGAAANAVISPFAGHGADPVSELGGFFVLIDGKLTYDENGTFTVSNDYRQIGLLRNPLLSVDGVTQASALDINQMERLTFGSVTGTTFNADETVTGSTSNSTGVVVDYDGTSVLRLVQVVGAFVPGETVVGADASGVLQTVSGTAISGSSSTIVLPNTASASSNTYNGFTINITGGTGVGQIRTISGYVGVTRTATVSANWTTPPNSTSTFSIANITAPDLEPFSGDIMYLENRRPIQRASDQVEDIKVVVQF